MNCRWLIEVTSKSLDSDEQYWVTMLGPYNNEAAAEEDAVKHRRDDQVGDFIFTPFPQCSTPDVCAEPCKNCWTGAVD